LLHFEFFSQISDSFLFPSLHSFFTALFFMLYFLPHLPSASSSSVFIIICYFLICLFIYLSIYVFISLFTFMSRRFLLCYVKLTLL
jgi:hypothetical protein